MPVSLVGAENYGRPGRALEEIMEAAWSQKYRDGKMYSRLRCDLCMARFHFTDSPRVTRLPRCPHCGSNNAHEVAA
jgi:DNA-directed RNA polymerase subunit RPC12/RpoP